MNLPYHKANAPLLQMARLLQTRLALATFKTRHGWENLDPNTMEPKFEMELKRKRPSSSETVSDSSSTSTDPGYPTAVINSSSPSTGPIFSDGIHVPGDNYRYRRRLDLQPPSKRSHPNPSGSRKRARSISTAAPRSKALQASWKDIHNLPQSSPVYNRQRPRYPMNETHTSFVSNGDTIPLDPVSPRLGEMSGDEEPELPPNTFHASQIRSSPPRTPPPTRARAARLRNVNASPDASHNPETGEEGADLLLFLATSPSPANPAMKARLFPPSTPPSRHPALPSSMMTTPSGGAFLAGFGGPNTPSTGFNFADFVNITPSPAQGAWGNRTPAAAKTPLAAREARRRLNFDALAPPTASPNVGTGSGGRAARQTGLGMELGGELMS